MDSVTQITLIDSLRTIHASLPTDHDRRVNLQCEVRELEATLAKIELEKTTPIATPIKDVAKTDQQQFVSFRSTFLLNKTDPEALQNFVRIFRIISKKPLFYQLQTRCLVAIERLRSLSLAPEEVKRLTSCLDCIDPGCPSVHSTDKEAKDRLYEYLTASNTSACTKCYAKAALAMIENEEDSSSSALARAKEVVKEFPERSFSYVPTIVLTGNVPREEKRAAAERMIATGSDNLEILAFAINYLTPLPCS